MAYRYAYKSGFYEDFKQEIYLNLWETLDNFENTKNGLAGYIKMQINHVFYQYIRSSASNLLFHPGNSKYAQLFKSLKYTYSSESTHKELKELGDTLGITTYEVILAFNSLYGISSYDYDSVQSTNPDFLEELQCEQDTELLYKNLERLPRHYYGVLHRYLRGEAVGMDKAIKYKALQKLKQIWRDE